MLTLSLQDLLGYNFVLVPICSGKNMLLSTHYLQFDSICSGKNTLLSLLAVYWTGESVTMKSNDN